MKTATVKLLKVEKVEAGPRGLGDGTVALGCHFEGARYHVWLNPVTLNPGEVVYKNCLVERNHPDYFNTRQLRITSQWSQKLVASMLHAYRTKNLLAKFEAEEAKEEEKRKAEAATAARNVRIVKAAPELLAAMEALLAIPVCKGHLPHIDQQRARKQAHAVIAKIEGR